MTKITWINSGSGNWSDAANWSGGAEPGASDTVSLSGTNTYAATLDVADTIIGGTVSDASASLVLDQVLGLKEAFALTAGYLQINGGGGISGGKLTIGTGASALLNGGSLSNVTVDGSLAANDAGGYLSGNINFAGANGAGTGQFNFNYGNFYAQNYLFAEGDTHLNGATMIIGNTGPGGSINILYAQDNGSTGATLTFGKTFTVDAAYGNSAIGGTDGAHDSIVNDGTIEATGGYLQIDATKFVNDGTLATTSGVLFFTGDIAAKLVDSVVNEPGGYTGVDGIVKGGTIDAGDGQVGSWGGSGELDGTSVQGTFILQDSPFTFTGKNSFAGIGGTGTGVLDFDYGNYYSNNYVTALGNTGFDNVTLSIGNTGTGGSSNILYGSDGSSNGTGTATLTLGKNFVLNAVAGNSALQDSDGAHDAIVNDGTIDATTSGGALDIDANKFTNKGVIDTANGGVVYFTGMYDAGLLDSVTIGSGGYAGIDGILKGGTLVTPDGQIGSFGGSGELDGVAVHGTLTIEDGGFTVTGKNIFAGSNGAGTATLNFDQGVSYANPTLTLLGSQTLDDATLNIGDTGLGGATNVLFSRDTGTAGVKLTLGPNFTVNAVAGNSALGSTDGAHDRIINDGTITAQTDGGNIDIAATRFTNDGSLSTGNGGVLWFTGAIDAGLVDSVTNNAGGYTGIDGVVTGGTITAGDGQVGSYNGSGVLDNVAITGTFTVQDSGFTVEGKTSFSGATVNFDLGNYYSTNYLWARGSVTLNNTTLNIGNTGLGGSTNELFNQDTTGTGATLTLGSGFVLNATQGNSAIGGTDGANDSILFGGTINVYDGATLTIDETRFSNGGTINVANGGTLHMTGTPAASPRTTTSAPAGTIVLHGTGDTLMLNSPANVGTITGFGAGDTIDLTGHAITALAWHQTSAAAGTLLLTESGGAQASLTLAGQYSANDFAISANLHEIASTTTPHFTLPDTLALHTANSAAQPSSPDSVWHNQHFTPGALLALVPHGGHLAY